MKRIIIATALSALLLSSLLLAGCSDKKPGDDPEQTTETTLDRTHEVPDTTIPDLPFQKDLATLTETEKGKASETVTKTGYTAKTTEEGWSVNSGIDYSVYDFVGSGTTLIEKLEEEYKGQNPFFYLYSEDEKGEPKRTQKTSTQVAKMNNILAFITENKERRTLNVYFQQVDLRVVPEYISIEGESGYFMTVSFKTNVPATFTANIAKSQGAAGAAIEHSGIVATGKDGTYTGTAKLTIPFLSEGDYYLNILSDGGEYITSVPVKISESEFTDRTYHLLYTGDWDLIRDPAYQVNLTELFYNSYARLYARWGTGSEPKTITFSADPTYDGVAYAMGTTVVVSVDYANGNPNDLGFFSHEITHSVQQYSGFSSTWWVENMANYGGFRYFHWSDKRYVQVYTASDRSLQDWGYEPYGNNKWFFAYMDAKYPTTVNEDGTYNYGLIDSLNLGIKNGTIKSDAKTDANFNGVFKSITGFDTYEDLRLYYVQELQTGTWAFVGFGEYTDNFLTESLKDAPDPIYPMVTAPEHGSHTAAVLGTAVTSGDNLCSGATIKASAGQVNASESADKLIDGNLNTKWCCTSASDPSYCLDGTQFWAIIDLGETKTFDTYTLYNTKTKENFGNMSEWEILISDDAENWTSVDYQTRDAGNIVSFNIGEQSARYILIRVYNGDGSRGTIRLYEFQLYKTEN